MNDKIQKDPNIVAVAAFLKGVSEVLGRDVQQWEFDFLEMMVLWRTEEGSSDEKTGFLVNATLKGVKFTGSIDVIEDPNEFHGTCTVLDTVSKESANKKIVSEFAFTLGDGGLCAKNCCA